MIIIKKREVKTMDNQAKRSLLAMINGLAQNVGNQYYSERVIKEEGIKTLITFIKNYQNES